MTQEAAVPQDLIAKLQGMWRQDIANANRAAPIRNSAISSGGVFSIQGGALVMKDDNGLDLFYVGPLLPNRADGTPQQGWNVWRADGSKVLELFDAYPTDAGGALQQALNWRDRSGNVVLADDTNSGQGIGRPYLPGVFYLARNTDWPKVTSTTFQTVYRAEVSKQHPKMVVRVWGYNDTAGATGQIQVLVNGTAWGTVQSTNSTTVQEFVIGPTPVAGAHISFMTVEIQACMTAGTGSVQVGAAQLNFQQT